MLPAVLMALLQVTDPHPLVPCPRSGLLAWSVKHPCGGRGEGQGVG